MRVVFPLMLLIAALSVQAQHGRRYAGYASYYPRVQAAVSISTPYLQLNWGGNPYYYSAGNFYRPYNGYYQSVPPPFGIHINVLPRGYYPMVMGGNPYYYYNGAFYQPSASQRDYQVVQAPIGAEVPSLPSDAKTMVIDGEKFYSVNGTYFKDAIHPNGELWYKVVGKHGVLNTNRNDGGYQQPQQRPQQYPSQQYPQQYPAQQYPQRAPQQQYPQQYPAQQYPQQAPDEQEYPKQYPSKQYPQIPQPAPQAIPQPQYPVQDEVQPAPRQTPQTENAEPVIRKSVPQAEQGTLPPAQNGSREAVRRIPGQSTSPVIKDEVKKDSTDADDDEEEMIEGGAPDLILHDNPNVGWVVDRLPENCKTVMIKTKKYFVAPNGTYYEEYIDGRQVRYKVAGKESTIKKD